MGSSQNDYARRNLEAIAARWDARADSWDDALEDADCHLNEDDAYQRFIRSAKRIISHRRRICEKNGVIDAGCGTGLVLGEIIADFAWGRGVDISQQMIRVARAKRISHAKFFLGDCFELSSLCPKAGAVVSRGVLLSHYGPEQSPAILAAIKDALAPGGFAIVDFLNQEGRNRHIHSPDNKTWFSRQEIRFAARQAGFSAVKILGDRNRRVLLLLAEN
ncbi:MAG TPA: class I SAM-dependent methyltransferase [Verrucomicrobiae bacterium]